MKTIWTMVLAVVLAATAVAAPAGAQCDPEAEVARARIAIERAQDVVERAHVPEARELLRAAVERAREAVELARRGQVEFACRRAVAAQRLAEKSAEIARRGIRGLEELELALRRTDEYLRDSAETVDDGPNDRARAVFTGARRQQENAWTEFRNRRARSALKLTLMARESVSRAVALAEGDEPGDGARLERELQSTDRMLEDAAAAIESSDDAADRLAQAVRLQEQAWARFRAERFRLAWGLTRQSRLLIARALGAGDQDIAVEDIEAMIATTGELIARLRETAAERDDERADDLLDRAAVQLEAARGALAEGRPRQALTRARTASALALDASEQLERRGFE